MSSRSGSSFGTGRRRAPGGSIFLYKAGCFVLESKQGSERKARDEEDDLIARLDAEKIRKYIKYQVEWEKRNER